MYNTKKIFVLPESKVSELVFENPMLLLLIDHFGLDFLIHEKTIRELCLENEINENVFIAVANLYNGFKSIDLEIFSKNDIECIIKFLWNSHIYYENEKYPEIKDLIVLSYEKNRAAEIKLIGQFFDEYFEEVKEHLSYENDTAFPYFKKLLKDNFQNIDENLRDFSVKEYSEHHTDIESKLNDLKALLLKHIPVDNDRVLRRKIITALFELEYDLNIHSLIEDTILIPLIEKIEKV